MRQKYREIKIPRVFNKKLTLFYFFKFLDWTRCFKFKSPIELIKDALEKLEDVNKNSLEISRSILSVVKNSTAKLANDIEKLEGGTENRNMSKISWKENSKSF